ncbi:MAG: APC family permease [Bacillota bacterium]
MANAKKIGFIPCVATAIGIVVSSSALTLMGEGFGSGGTAFLISMVVAAFLNLCVAFSFAELSGMLPVAGGINHYTLPAMGYGVGIMAVLNGYFSVSILTNSAESFVAGDVLSTYLFPGLGLEGWIWALIILAVLTLINLRSVKSYAYSQVFFTSVMVGSMVILSIVGLLGLGNEPAINPQWGFDLSAGGGPLLLLGFSFWLFIGLEFVCPLAEEIENPNKFIPLAMVTALCAIFVSDTLFGFCALKYVDQETLFSGGTPHVRVASAVLGRPGEIWIGIISLVATCSTLNTYIAAVPRMLFGMAHEGQFPKCFGKLNRLGSPFWGVLLIGVITAALVICFHGNADAVTLVNTFVTAGCIGWLLCYCVSHLDVLVLRKKYPDIHRPFKTPAAFPIIGLLGCLFTIIYIWPDGWQTILWGWPSEGKESFMSGSVIIFMFAGIVLVVSTIWTAIWVKCVMKKGFFETVPLEKLKEEMVANSIANNTK